MTQKAIPPEERCQGRIWKRYNYVPCSNRGSTEYKGKRYCRQHNPALVAQRRSERSAKWQAERDAKQRMWKREECIQTAEDTVIKAAKAWHLCSTHAKTLALHDAVEALNKAEQP